MKLAIIIFALAVLATNPNAARAQGAALSSPHAAHKNCFRTPSCIVGEGIIITSLVLDGQSTCRGFTTGLIERNIIMRGAHSCKGTVGLLVVGGGVYTATHLWLHSKTYDDGNRFWRLWGNLQTPLIVCAFHCTAASRNYVLESNHNCPAGVGCAQ